jgi:hypothetical protein
MILGIAVAVSEKGSRRTFKQDSPRRDTEHNKRKLYESSIRILKAQMTKKTFPLQEK